MTTKNIDWKILDYIDVISKGGHPELSINMGLLAVKPGNIYAHAIAVRCVSVYERYNLDLSILEMIFNVISKSVMPTYLVVDVGKKLINLRRSIGLNTDDVVVVLNLFQTTYCEHVLRIVEGEDFRFDRKYETKKPDEIFSFELPEKFSPKEKVAIHEESDLFLNKDENRNKLEVYTVRGGTFYYGEGEYIVLDTNDYVVEGTMSSNYIVERYQARNNGSKKSSNKLFIPRNYTPPRNYCHWICDYLPMIILFSEYIGEKFDLPFYEPITDYQRESLSLIANVNVIECKEWDIINANEIYFTSASNDFKHPMNLADPLLINYLQSVTLRDEVCEPANKVYLSRRKADRRHLIDESKMINILKKNGFVIVDCEDLSWGEQVKFFSKAKVIVSVHGAGLTNMVFAQKCENIIELFPRGYGTNAFQIMADSLGIKYSYYSNSEISKEGSQFSDVDCNIELVANYILNVCS